MGRPSTVNGSANTGSLFRVGESIGVSHVLIFVSLLVVFIVVLEQLLHKLEHSVKQSRKHQEMLRKVYRELMILGFLGVAIKVYKEITHISAYSDAIVAFQCADLTIFILAVALILQAICVFLALRHENYELEEAELLSSSDLARTIALRNQERGIRRFEGWPVWWFATNKTDGTSDAEIQDLVELRVLRHLFLRRYGLPELFPFSKYVRQAQDNQITHMIDVEISVWLLLLGVAWAIDGAIVLVQHIDGYHAESRAMVLVFLVFSWSLVALHVLVAVYFRNGVVQLLRVERLTHQSETVACLTAIGELENAALRDEMASDALLAMQEVQERQDAKYSALKRQRRRTNDYLMERDTGFQLLATAVRHAIAWCRRSRGVETKPRVDSDVYSTVTATTSMDLGDAGHHHPQQQTLPQSRRCSAELSAKIPWFSRKAWQFVVMVIMMLNGLYLALLCQCIFYQFGLLATYSILLRMVIVVGLPLPVLLNMVWLQPQILHNFMIVGSILQVDVATLSNVVTHFSEIVELRTEFARTCLACLDVAGMSRAEFQRALEAKDRARSGFIELEQLRLVLRSITFRLSHFRFNSVAKLLFELKGKTVEYAQVLRMIALAQPADGQDLVADSTDPDHTHALDHHRYVLLHPGHVLLRQSVFFEDGDALALNDDAEAVEPTVPTQQDSGFTGRDAIISVSSADSMAALEPARAGAVLATVSETEIENETEIATTACDSGDNRTVSDPSQSETHETAMQRPRPPSCRRRSSFQNTSVRTLRSLYLLSGPDFEIDDADAVDPTCVIAIDQDGGDDDVPTSSSVYVRM